MSYHFAEIFYSIQGEGHRAGTPTVFARFAGCNLQCNVAEHGFDCDTDFSKKFSLETVDGVESYCREVDTGYSRRVIFTGGEPGLQLDAELVEEFWDCGWYVAVETNGMYKLPRVDWISCSPKIGIPRHQFVVDGVDEIRLVVGAKKVNVPAEWNHEQGLPRAQHWFLSPTFNPDGTVDPDALAQCLNLVKTRPAWRISMQQHKAWGVR